MTDYAGIDYGMGETNIDPENGIRYGVISQNAILQAWADSSEPEYGEPICPKCGNPATTEESHTEQHENGVTVWTEHPADTEDYECSGCGDYRCDNCRYMFDGDEAFGDEPLSYSFDSEGIQASCGSDGDIFVTKSPYYTHAQFCSPCAPGAGYLENPCKSGPMTYCFPADWFDDESPCPYPIFRVDTGEQVYTPKNSDE